MVTLLPKKGDLQEIKNWRPVSLLCKDLKIFSKVLANRLKDVMGQVVLSDQTYCIPGRSIMDNITLIRDILDVSGYLDLDIGFISIDQEKAFDRIEHQYLWNTLDAFGFGSTFRGMIQVLYRDIESVLKINGGLSAPFEIGRGIRQGCALSGMLYSLAIEPMLNKLRSCIEGFKLGNVHSVQHQISAYLDDVMILINGKKYVINLESTVNEFGVISAARVNWEKSDAMIRGKWKNGFPILPGGLNWKKGGLKYLGVYLEVSVQQKNWDGIIEKMEGRLKKWRLIHSQMSFRGRVLILNNLIASTMWHKLSCVEPPTGLLARSQRILVDFFWDRLHWVPQSVLFLPLEEGGQGLVSLSSRYATWYGEKLQLYKQAGKKVGLRTRNSFIFFCFWQIGLWQHPKAPNTGALDSTLSG